MRNRKCISYILLELLIVLIIISTVLTIILSGLVYSLNRIRINELRLFANSLLVNSYNSFLRKINSDDYNLYISNLVNKNDYNVLRFVYNTDDNFLLISNLTSVDFFVENDFFNQNVDLQECLNGNSYYGRFKFVLPISMFVSKYNVCSVIYIKKTERNNYYLFESIVAYYTFDNNIETETFKKFFLL